VKKGKSFRKKSKGTGRITLRVNGRTYEMDIGKNPGQVDHRDEMVTEVEVPRINGPIRQTFLKFTLRKPVDFAIVSVASVITLKEGVCEDARLALGAVAPKPIRAKKAEEVIRGRPIDHEIAVEGAERALGAARPLRMNPYKVEIAKALVKRAVLGESL